MAKFVDLCSVLSFSNQKFKLTSLKEVEEKILISFSFDTETLKTKYVWFLTQKIDSFLTFKSWII